MINIYLLSLSLFNAPPAAFCLFGICYIKATTGDFSSFLVLTAFCGCRTKQQVHPQYLHDSNMLQLYNWWNKYAPLDSTNILKYSQRFPFGLVLLTSTYKYTQLLVYVAKTGKTVRLVLLSTFHFFIDLKILIKVILKFFSSKLQQLYAIIKFRTWFVCWRPVRNHY